MQIFRSKPLCLIISLLIAFMAAAPFMSAATKLFSVLAAAGIFVFSLLLFKRDKKFGYRVSVMLTALVMLFAVAVRTYVYYDLERYDAKRLYGITAKAEIKITEILYSDNYVTLMSGRIKSFNGEKFDVGVYLECEYMTDYDPGDTACFLVEVYEPDVLIEEGYMTRVRLLSSGYTAYCLSVEDSAVLTEKGHGIKYTLERINEKLCAEMRSLLGDASGSLSSALALGNDSSVDDSVKRDFRRSGLSHILALSGSHIVLIIGTCELVLRKYLRLRKRVRYPIVLMLLPLYVFLVTSPIPVIRAGLMYAVFGVVEITGRKSDSMTNLFLSAFIMMLADPSMVFSMSLWMSFLATFALIVFLPFINKIVYVVRNKNKGSLFTVFALSVTASAAVTVIGILSNVVFMPAFGSFSTVAVITNIVFGPLLTVYLVGSMILLLALPIPPLAGLIAFPLSKLGELILLGINRSASYKYSVISLETGFAKEACAVFFIVALIFAVVKVRRKSIILIPTAALISLLLVNAACFSQCGDVRVLDIKDSLDESMIVSNGDNFSIVDISNGRLGNLTSAAKEAKSMGSCEFDSIVLTHYHRYHISSLRKFLGREVVRKILIPIPNNDYDTEIYEKITAMLDELDVPYSVYSDDILSEIVDDVYLKGFPLERIKRSTHTLVSFSLFYEDSIFTYVGASVNEGRICERVNERIKISDTVIFGRHGPIQKTEPQYLCSEKSKIFINDSLIAEKLSSICSLYPVRIDTCGRIEFAMKAE